MFAVRRARQHAWWREDSKVLLEGRDRVVLALRYARQQGARREECKVLAIKNTRELASRVALMALPLVNPIPSRCPPLTRHGEVGCGRVLVLNNLVS